MNADKNRIRFMRCPLDSGNRSGRLGGAVPLDRGGRPRPPCWHAGQGPAADQGVRPSAVSYTHLMIVERREDFSVEEGAKIVDLQCGAKYDGWCYEQEVRIHLRRNEKDGETGQYFREFSERLVLKEVIAGVRFPYSKKLIQDALSGYSGQEEVTILKGRRSTQTFAIVLDEKWS